ncbi:MAG: flavocytochrome c, partial [Burkholderiales bacterium]|nr:flavocytochrome c [Burkholderiales bacterium]
MKKLLVASFITALFAMPAMADQKADIVVIGSGGAGLSAAVTAHDLNKNVIVVEKMPMVGGNTNRAAGGMNAAESQPQKALGIEDSVQSMYDDTMKGGHNINNPELVRTLSENARYSIDFLNELGADLKDVGMMAGASHKRAHRPTGGDFVGAEIVKTLKKASDERKIPIMMNTKVEKILVNDQGQVVGVEVKGKDGKTEKINAEAVIIASGGFGANQEMLVELNPSLKGFGTTNHPGATGDGIKLGQEVGADVVDMKEIQTHPTVVPGNGEMITEAVRGNGAILV